MLDHHYLSLHMVRLKHDEQWTNEANGLCYVFPRGGAGICVCGSATQPLLPGDVLVLSAEASGRFSPGSGDAEFAFWWFSSEIEHLFPLFAANEICLISLVASRFKNGKRYMASSALASECHRLIGDIAPQFSLEHRSHLLNVAAAVLSAEFQTFGMSRAGFMRSDEQMTQTLEKLSAADVLDLPVTELARRFNCSQRHLSRLFHDRFGVSVAALRMEMRLLKAMALLRNPDAKVIDVAEECGFNHLGLFNTCFKRRFGSSPGKWRQNTYEVGPSSASPNGSQPDCKMLNLGLCPWSPEAKDARPVKAGGLQPDGATFPGGLGAQANRNNGGGKSRASTTQCALKSASGVAVGLCPSEAIPANISK
jgi:AraC-like DNA-binding protein